MASGSNRPGLTHLTFQILVALAAGDRHGYGIIKEIEARAGAGAAPTTGALYLALQRMEADGLIQPARRPPPGADARRHYYALTSAGRAAAEAESLRLSALLTQVRAKTLIG